MAFGPREAANHALDRASQMLAESQGSNVSSGVAEDMMRSSVVMAVAALDTYMHRLIVDRADIWNPLPGKLAETEIQFEQLVEMAKDSYEAARREPFNSRPGVQAKRILRDQLLRETFQSLKALEKGLGMAGAKRGGWPQIRSSMGVTSPELKSTLGHLVFRRNQIAHEGDYKRMERPRDPQMNDLEAADVTDAIDFVRRLVEGIDRSL